MTTPIGHHLPPKISQTFAEQKEPVEISVEQRLESLQISTSSTMPPAALPAQLTLQQLADFSIPQILQRFYCTGEQLTRAKPQQVVDVKENFFALRDLLEKTIAAEWLEEIRTGTSCNDRALRDSLFTSLASLQDRLQPQLKDIQNGEGEFANLPEKVRKQLEFFVSRGRGAETVTIYARVPLGLDLLDPEYDSKIMQFAKDKWHFRADGTVIPGAHRALTKEEKKCTISFDQPLSISNRSEIRESISTFMVDSFRAISARLAPHCEQFGQKAQVFLRGPLAAGKSTFLEQHFGLSEEAVGCADTAKKRLGGNLAHHEAAALHDCAMDAAKQFPYSIRVATNVRDRDSAFICAPKGQVHVVYDLAVSLDEMHRRIEQRAVEKGIRRADLAEIAQSHADSVKNRPAIIAAALQNDKIVWYLYSEGSLLARIVNKQLSVENRDQLMQLCEQDLDLKQALQSQLA